MSFTVRFIKKIAALEVAAGSVLMRELLKAGIPVASSCQGDGICGKCRVHVLTGAENLSPVGELERMAHERLKLPKGTRLSCQAQVRGDITIDTSYW